MEEQLICHYTTIDSFENIIKTKKIFATSLSCLNDAEEFKYAKKLTKNVIEKAIRQTLDDKTLNLIFDPKKGGYIFCASKYESDDGLLSMWRGYGKSNEAIGIIFSVNNVKNNKKTFDTFVNYEDKLTLEDEKSIGSPEVAEFVTQCINGKLNAYHKSAADSILKIALKYKYPAFKEEQEYRVCYCEGEIKRRTRCGREINYIEEVIDIEKDINKIIIGPSSYQDELEEKIKSILKEHGLSKEIVKSKIPFLWGVPDKNICEELKKFFSFVLGIFKQPRRIGKIRHRIGD